MAFPTITLLTFGFLAHKNLRQLTNTGQLNGFDRQLILMVCLQLILMVCLQLILMVCLQLILVILSTLPYGIYNAYILATSNRIKSVEQNDREFLFLTVTTLFGVFNFGVKFSFFLTN